MVKINSKTFPKFWIVTRSYLQCSVIFQGYEKFIFFFFPFLIALATYSLFQTEYLRVISLNCRINFLNPFYSKLLKWVQQSRLNLDLKIKCWDFFSEFLFDLKRELKRAGVKLGWNKSSTIWKKHDPLLIHTFNLSFHILQSSISWRLKIVQVIEKLTE